MDFRLDCKERVLAPAAALHLGLDASPAPKTLSDDVTDDGTSYEWRWLVSVPMPSASAAPSFESGVDSILYVTVNSNANSAIRRTGSATATVTIRDRTTFSSLTGWVQGLAGFIGAFVALIAGIANFVKTGNPPTTKP